MKIKVGETADKGQSLSLEQIEAFVSRVKSTGGSVQDIRARVSWGGRLTSLYVETLHATLGSPPVNSTLRDIGTRKDKS